MKENFTSINIIMDRSGSMSSLVNDTIGGFNQFLTEQKQLPGEAVLTLCTFNTSHHLMHDCVALASVPELDRNSYTPNGGTALLDAMGATIDEVGKKLAAMPEEDRPSKVIFLVITDGEENSSRKYTKAQIKEMVSHQQDKYKWEFIFFGANIDAIAEGGALGIDVARSVNYSASSIGTKSLYRNISETVGNYRTTGTIDNNKLIIPTVDIKKDTP